MPEPQASVIRETDAEAIRLSRTLLRTARFATLAALDPADGWPLASRVGVATDCDGAPLILVSGLSAHTRALLADPRCSLLVGEPGKGDPLAHPRLSLRCSATALQADSPARQEARRRYLNHSPKAKLYADLGDFAFFRLEPQRASLNGGFGRAYLLERSDLLLSGPVVAALARSEQGALDHMNADHGDAIDAYAAGLAHLDGTGWTLTGLDVEGMVLANGDRVARIPFDAPLGDAGDLRRILVELASKARAADRSAI